MSPSVSVRLLLTQSDARLVELARGGHERAFEALVQRYRRPLLGYCRRLLLPDERAEDALQQGLLQAWLALREGAEVHNVRPWLYRIVHNAAVNALRVSGYDYAQLSETLSGASAPAEDLDRRVAVREALAGLAALPEMQREALLQTAVDGHSYHDAAAALGLSEPAVRGLVHRARTALRAAATALTPAPLVTRLLGAPGGANAPLAGRLGDASAPIGRLLEVGAGGGSAGVVGVLVKTGTAVLTVGALVGGMHTLRHTPARSHRPALTRGEGSAGARRAGAGAAEQVAGTQSAARALHPSLRGVGPRPGHTSAATFGARPHRSLSRPLSPSRPHTVHSPGGAGAPIALRSPTGLGDTGAGAAPAAGVRHGEPPGAQGLSEQRPGAGGDGPGGARGRTEDSGGDGHATGQAGGSSPPSGAGASPGGDEGGGGSDRPGSSEGGGAGAGGEGGSGSGHGEESGSGQGEGVERDQSPHVSSEDQRAAGTAVAGTAGGQEGGEPSTSGGGGAGGS